MTFIINFRLTAVYNKITLSRAYEKSTTFREIERERIGDI